jgi:hypothetical protein
VSGNIDIDLPTKPFSNDNLTGQALIGSAKMSVFLIGTLREDIVQTI